MLIIIARALNVLCIEYLRLKVIKGPYDQKGGGVAA